VQVGLRIEPFNLNRVEEKARHFEHVLVLATTALVATSVGDATAAAATGADERPGSRGVAGDRVHGDEAEPCGGEDVATSSTPPAASPLHLAPCVRAVTHRAHVVEGRASGDFITERDAWPWMPSNVPRQIRLSAALAPSDGGRPFTYGGLTFENASADSVEATFGVCPFGVRLYADTLPRGAPSWDDRPGPEISRAMGQDFVRLGPRERHPRRVTGFVARILAT